MPQRSDSRTPPTSQDQAAELMVPDFIDQPPAPGEMTVPDFIDQPSQGEPMVPDFVDQQEGGFRNFAKAMALGAKVRAAAQTALDRGIDNLVHGRVSGNLAAMRDEFLDQMEAKPADPKKARGILGAAQAGYQSSATGLLIRGKLPDVVLDPHDSSTKWYESLVASGAQMVADLPEMIVGGTAGGAAGIETGPGALATAGAGAMAAPTALRESLMLAYGMGDVQSLGDFLSRTTVVLKNTARDAGVGALTAGVGGKVSQMVTPLAGTGAQRLLAGATVAGAEVGTMTVAPALLEGRLPEPEDFAHAAILMVGMKSAHHVTGKLMDVYARTGLRPEEVLAKSKTDPTIVEDLVRGAESHTFNGEVVDAKAGADRAGEAGTGGAVPANQPGELPGSRSRSDASLQVVLGTPDQARAASGAVEGIADLPRSLQPLASRVAAMDAMPGDKAAQVLEAPFADLPEAKLPYHLNLKYIDGPDSMKALQTRMAEVYRSDIDAARGGKRTWADVEAITERQVADLTGQGLTEVRSRSGAGQPAGDVELKVMGDMLMQSTVEAAEAIKRVKEAGNTVSDAMRLEALEAIHRSAMIQAEFTGASAELGRAMNYLKRAKELRTQGEGIRRLVEDYGHDPIRMLELAGDIDTPEGLAKFAREATKATTEQQILEAWKAGLVSGPVTHVANVLGNSTYMALRPLVDLAASGAGILARAETRVHYTEPLARVLGDLSGVMDGLKLAKVAFAEDAAGGKAGSREAIPGTAGHVIRTPFRLLSGMDQVFRTMTERGEAYALGARQAAAEGFHPSTREFRERMVEIANNPTEAQLDQIQAFGERGTFNSQLGEKGQAINNAIVKAHLEFAVPFRGTPANIFKEMTRLTPAAPVIAEWRQAVKAGGVEAHKALAEVAVGTALSAFTMTLALSGHISGAGDPDPDKRRVQLAAGWQPYSIKVNGTWYSYQRFQPVGTLVGLAADMADAWQHMTPEESDKVVKILGTAFSNAVTHQTFLQGIATLMDAISQPERKMARFGQNLSGSLVPALLAQTAQMVDPYRRETDSILAAIQSRIPGLRETLTVQRDVFGEPVANDERLGLVSPVTVKAESQDKVRTEAARLKVGVAKVPKAIQLPTGGIGGKLGRVPLTPEQQDVFGDVAGHLAYAVMSRMVDTPGWDEMPDMMKARAFKVAFEKANVAGKAAALSPEDRQREARRIVAEVNKRLGR